MTINSQFNQIIASKIKLSEEDSDKLKITVAVSGGSDSIALCLLTKAWIKQFKGEIYAITIDHKLRENSTPEAQEVNEIMKKHDINHYIIPWLGEKPKANIQEEARIARYNLLTEYCLKNNIKYLLTGHQMNDQAENFLIRAQRGSGLYGLSGIPSVTKYKGIQIIRPLLTFKKQELQDFLQKQNVKWIEDPSNENEKFTRVKVRKTLSLNPEFIDSFAKISENLANARETIEFYVKQNIEQLINYTDSGQAFFEYEKFNSLPQEIRFRVLEKILQQISNSSKPARGERIARLLDKIALGDKFTAYTLSGCLIERKKKLLFIKYL